MPGHKKDKMKTVILLVAFGLIPLILITARAYCSEDNPYCAGDEARIQELTRDFTERYGEGVSIYQREAAVLPASVGGIRTEVFTGDPEDVAFSFLSENASFFGIDINDLEYYGLLELSSTKYVDFRQLYQGIPVSGGKMRVFIAQGNGTIYEDGTIYTVVSKYFPCLDLDVTPAVTAEEAAEVVKEDLGAESLVTVKTSFSGYGAAQKEFLPVVPELIVYPKNMGEEVYLCWEFRLTTEMPYGPNGSWYYLIDAHTGAIVGDGSLTFGAAQGNGNTGDNSSSNTENTDNSSHDQADDSSLFSGSFLSSALNYGSPYSSSFFSFYSHPFSSPFFNPLSRNYGEGYHNSLSSPFYNPFSSSFFNLMPGYETSYHNFFNSLSNPFPPGSALFSGSWEEDSITSYDYINRSVYNPLFPGTAYFPLGNSYHLTYNSYPW